MIAGACWRGAGRSEKVGNPARTRTWTNWTKTSCATITPRGCVKRLYYTQLAMICHGRAGGNRQKRCVVMITPGSDGTPGSVGTAWTPGTDWRHSCSAGVRTQGLMRHGPMAWTPGTFWTVGNDAMDAGDSLGVPPSRRYIAWERRRPGGNQPGSAAVPAVYSLGAPPSRRHLAWECRRPGGI